MLYEVKATASVGKKQNLTNNSFIQDTTQNTSMPRGLTSLFYLSKVAPKLDNTKRNFETGRQERIRRSSDTKII